MALIVLDRQHVGKPGQNDMGAWGDFDKDAKTEVQELEAILTGFYGLYCEVRLRELGHNVISLSDGFYSERHKRACLYGADAYIALHLNAGKGEYSSCFYDYRSTKGKLLADSIATEFKKKLPVSDALVRETKPDGQFPRPWGCINGVFSGKPVACLVEPLFIDNFKHQQFLSSESNIHMLGCTLAEGIHNWLQRQ